MKDLITFNGKKFFIVIPIIVFTVFIGLFFAGSATASNGNYVPGKALVCVKGGASALENSSKNANLQKFSVNESLMTLDSNSKIQKAIAYHDQNLTSYLTNSNTQDLMRASNEEACEILLVDCQETESFVNQISKLNCVMWAQPDYIAQTDDVDDNDVYIDNSEASQIDSSEIKDEHFQYQWAYEPGILGGKVNLDASQTWAEQEAAGDYSPTVVAVIDTGVDYTHPDLKDNMWNEGLNYPQLTALGGGQYGVNYVPDEDTTDPMDRENGHGTHCASSIASPFNSIGVRGVNGHDVRIIGCRFMGQNGGDLADAIKCFNYVITAKKCGVDISVISNSWGDSNPYALPFYALECVTTEAGLNGIVDCFSSGNDSRDLDNFPNRSFINPYTIKVSACDDWGRAASFSNWGKHSVHLFSPGTRMLNCISTSEDLPDSQKPYYSWIHPESYSYFRESFDGATCDVGLSAFKEGDEKNVINSQNSEVGFKLDFSSFKDGDNVYIRFKINKDKLGELIEKDDNPYYSALFNFTNVELKGNHYSLKYYDGTQHQDLVSGYIKMYNNDYEFTTLHLGENDFYKIDGDYVYVEMNFEIESNSPDSSFTIYDFGFGKKGGEYGYKNGTSMATPVVAGIVSHISPRLNSTGSAKALDAVAYVKGSTVDSMDLEEKSINPGVVNLKNAYEGLNDHSKLHPVVESADIVEDPNSSGQIVTLHGHFFGNEKGQAGYDYATYSGSSIVYWSDTEVVFYAAISTEHLGECFVIRANDNKKGRNFFKIGSHYLDYVNLPVSNITYKVDDIEFSVKDLNVLRSATTDSNMYVLYGVQYGYSGGLNVMERYNYAEQNWSTIDLSSLDIKGTSKPCYYSIASGADEIYFLYCNNNYEMCLATYSENADSFVDIVKLECASFGDMIFNYHGQLMLAGRLGLYDKKRDFDIVKIYPNTGNVYENFGNFPDFGDEFNDVCCGNVSVYGDIIYISDYAKSFEMGTDSDEFEIGATLIYDGYSWHRGSDEILTSCEDQTLFAASSATSNGLISTGIIQRVNGRDDNLYDTWTYDVANDSWSLTNYVFNNTKVRTITSICHDNNYYVLAQRSIFGDIAFRYLPLSKIDAVADNITSNVAKEIPPQPVPPTPVPDNPYAATGDFTLILFVLLMLISLVACNYLKRREII